MLIRCLIGAVALAGCAAAGGPGVSPAADCRVIERGRSEIAPPDTATLLVTDSSRWAEEVERQQYETLVRIDCGGRVIGGLARSWSREADGAFRIGLVPGATFGDGRPIDAAAVLASWERGRRPAGFRGALLAAEAVDSLSLRVRVAGGDTAPSPLADRALAVGGALQADGRPAESGRYRRGPATTPNVAWLTAGGPAGPGTLRIARIRTGADPRDAVDAVADLVLTRDDRVVEYAQARNDRGVAELPWDRTYLLVATGGGGSGSGPGGGDRESLAADAVRALARPARGPFGWLDPLGCPARTDSAGGGRLVGYHHADPTARELAERVVALAAGGGGSWVTAALGPGPLRPLSLGGPALDSAVAWRRVTGAVVAVPRGIPVRCGAWPPGAAVLPLIETRSYLVVRRPIPGLVVDGDGGLRFGAGR